jgi:hypothetical protein
MKEIWVINKRSLLVKCCTCVPTLLKVFCFFSEGFDTGVIELSLSHTLQTLPLSSPGVFILCLQLIN